MQKVWFDVPLWYISDLNALYEKKRVMFSEFKQSEADFQKLMSQKRHKQRQESFKKREEDRKAKEEALWKERWDDTLPHPPGGATLPPIHTHFMNAETQICLQYRKFM